MSAWFKGIWAKLLAWQPPFWFEVGRPWALIALSVLTLIVLIRLRRSEIALSKPRRILAGTFAFLALICATLAAGEVSLVRPADRMSVIVAVDRSRSIEQVPDASKRIGADLLAAELKMKKDDQLGIVHFAATAALAEPLHKKGEGGLRSEPTLARDASDLGAGLRRAVDEVLAGGGGRVVLVSDGVQNRGDVLAAAARARALGVPVDVVVLEQKVTPDLRVVSVRAPTLSDEGESIELRIVVHVPPRPTPVDVEVKVTRDGTLLSTFRAKVSSGEDVIRFKDRAPDAGLHRYDVHVRPLDSSVDSNAEDNEGTSFLRVRGPSTVLVLQKEPEKAGPLKAALETEGYRVVVRSRNGTPSDLAELASFDLVVLADLPARDFLPAQLEAMKRYVKDFGGGLLLLGSDQSMGPGGYGKTPIEEISPVNFDLMQERRKANLTELIIIDFSGSMAAMVDGQMKIALANEAAARAAGLLGKDDRLGVWHVDTEVYPTVPLGPVKDIPTIQKKIRAVGPGGGGIFIDLSLREGYKALEKEKEGIRHMLLFSDGADAEERDNAPTLVKAAFKKGITTSVIALGEGPDCDGLAEMAKLGGGRYYLITDARKLPAVFAQETILAAKSSVREQDFLARIRSSSPAVKGLSFTKEAGLRGYLVTQMKPRAELVLDGPDGDPILAIWPQGLGHVAAFMSDFTDKWGGEFIKWPGHAQFATQLAREIGRKSDEARVRLTSEAHDGVLKIHAEPTALSSTSGLLHLKAHVEGPDGKAHDVDLLPGAGGSYVAELPADVPGPYVVRALDVGADGKGVTPAGLSATLLSRADELRPTGSETRTLERIAQLSGGVVYPSFASVFDLRTGLRPTGFPLAPWLLIAALVLMLLGVAARRLGLPSFILRLFERTVAEPALAIAGKKESSLARDLAVVALPQRKKLEQVGPSSIADRGPIRTVSAKTEGNAAGLAAGIAQRRQAEKDAKKPSTATSVVVATRPTTAKRTEQGAGSLADLAKKRRDKKE